MQSDARPPNLLIDEQKYNIEVTAPQDKLYFNEPGVVAGFWSKVAHELAESHNDQALEALRTKGLIPLSETTYLIPANIINHLDLSNYPEIARTEPISEGIRINFSESMERINFNRQLDFFLQYDINLNEILRKKPGSLEFGILSCRISNETLDYLKNSHDVIIWNIFNQIHVAYEKTSQSPMGEKLISDLDKGLSPQLAISSVYRAIKDPEVRGAVINIARILSQDNLYFAQQALVILRSEITKQRQKAASLSTTPALPVRRKKRCTIM